MNARLSQSMKRIWSREIMDRLHDARRGFSVPSYLRNDYALLRRKKFNAREAAEILGILPRQA